MKEKEAKKLHLTEKMEMEMEFNTLSAGAIQPLKVGFAKVKNSSEQGLYRLECPKCHGFVGVFSYEDYGYEGDPSFHSKFTRFKNWRGVKIGIF